MSILITATAMVSDQTAHAAARSGTYWRLSWLPDRLLDLDQAVTGMTIAETVATPGRTSDPRWRPHLNAWAAELDLTGTAAAYRALQPPLPLPTAEEMP